uniref:Uncharacterized protein n=1 Tax=Bionectria ochroleuca TaxID=29856 RepID=A0A8H7K6Z8_BIOOC
MPPRAAGGSTQHDTDLYIRHYYGRVWVGLVGLDMMTLEARQMLGALHVFYCVNLGPWRVHYEISRSRRGVCVFLHRYDPDICLLSVAIDCESSPIAASPGVCGTINHNRKIKTWQTETGIPYSYSRFERHLSCPNSQPLSQQFNICKTSRNPPSVPIA